MKVLHIYSGNLYGGIETFLFTLARLRHLCPEMEADFALCFLGRLHDEIATTGAAIHDMGEVKFSRPWTLLRARGRLSRLLAKNRYDAVICHACWPHAVFGRTILRSSAKLVGWLHDALKGNHWLDKSAGKIGAHLLIANSQYSAACSTTTFRDTPMQVLYLPIEKKELSNAHRNRSLVRIELKASDSDAVILLASRLERWKGHSILIQALSDLNDLSNWKAYIVGGPQRSNELNYYNELKLLAVRKGIANRVHFLGQRDDVAGLMNAADIYCQPNESPEPFGVSFIEALYAGLPIVTSNVGGGAEIVNDSCGKLTPLGDCKAVSQALRSLIVSPEIRRELAANGPDRASSLCDPKRSLTAIHEAIYRILPTRQTSGI